jgi:putative spermidine/putrescine transport system permease protein
MAALIAVFLISPTLFIVPMSFSADPSLHFPPARWSGRWYMNFFASDMWLSGAVTSLKVGLLAAGIATLLGTTIAFGTIRGRIPGRLAVSTLILSPLIVPIIVVAIGMYFVFSRWGLVGTFQGLVVAHAALGVPFVVINVSAVLRTVDMNLELAAQSLGASAAQTFARITLPLIVPGVAAGALFAFITSWDEVVVAIFISSPQVRTLPIVMWSQVRGEVDPTIAAVSTMLTLFSMATLIGFMLVRRRLAA